MKINDIESTTHVTIITKHDDDEGKWKSLCCVLVIIIGLIIIIMAITGELNHK